MGDKIESRRRLQKKRQSLLGFYSLILEIILLLQELYRKNTKLEYYISLIKRYIICRKFKQSFEN